ncbi:uncharacterized protein EI90DRAFT_3121807 [Cantharellus anzutake]|uniref:uncharacterized protein n=1 Tax=Cantharellus anzutake TaxID=1750568 RepID=UPI0019060936|nr:uncharacterized protein EI90DRAFT_3121807 [Cantharellus anzutake]KAF8333479.1 hypothetical protein EI90DRAFT_3121807 [Cantharellus anzutake]
MPFEGFEGKPLCYKCGKIGYASECLNHLYQAKIFALGINNGAPEPIPVFDNQDEVGEPSGETPDGPIGENGEAEDRFINDPYDPTYQHNVLESKPEDEVVFRNMGLPPSIPKAAKALEQPHKSQKFAGHPMSQLTPAKLHPGRDATDNAPHYGTNHLDEISSMSVPEKDTVDDRKLKSRDLKSP